MLANNKVNIRLGFGHIRPFISNDFHSCRATVDYIPKAHSKLPFNYAPVSWDIIDSQQFFHLSGEAIKLYAYLSRNVDLRIKQKTRGEREYLIGRTFAKKYEITSALLP